MLNRTFPDMGNVALVLARDRYTGKKTVAENSCQKASVNPN